MTASSNAPRYAPEDPTLPKPWRALVDGSTGYIYFWNPETNVTQYEHPLPPPPTPPPSLPRSSAVAVVSKPTYNSRSKRDDDDDDDNDNRSRHYGGGKSSRSSRAAPVSAEAYRRQHEITVMGDNVPAPFTTFDSTGFPSEILREVDYAGFSAPTPIQAQAWPIALASRDIVAIAKTGSGKTLGYLIPGFLHLKRLRNNAKMGPTVLVLSPTRELATQIQDEAVKFGRSSRISCVCLYGGAPKGPQLRDLDRGVDVVVATPGRLNDILEMRRVSLHQVSYLVLDEADRMLDMGFEPQIRKIVKEIPPHRQTLMFTATWPKEVRKIAADLLVNPVQVNIGNIDELVANKAITQYVEVITYSEKQRRLEQLLRSQEPGSKIIIFCSTKKMCDQLARSLSRQFGAAAIHGDKSQSERDYVLGQFRNGRSPILVATDVAARGLDIKDIRIVINYDFPTGIEDYVHRIGRTGRAGATGIAHTFFSDQDSKYALDLVKVLEGADQRVPRELRDMVARGGYGGKSRRWSSGGRDGGRSDGGRSYGGDRGGGQSFGGRRGDSSNGKGGRGDQPYSGRSDSGQVSRGRSPPRDRLDNDYRNKHTTCSRGCRDAKDHMAASDYRIGAKGRSRSRSPYRSYGGGWDKCRSRSRSRTQGRTKSRSRSRSHSLSRCRSMSIVLNRSAKVAEAGKHSPLLKRGPSPSNYLGVTKIPNPSQARTHSGDQEQLESTDDGATEDRWQDHYSSPRDGRSDERLKYNDKSTERLGPPSLAHVKRGCSSLKQDDTDYVTVNGRLGSSGRSDTAEDEEEGILHANEDSFGRAVGVDSPSNSTQI